MATPPNPQDQPPTDIPPKVDDKAIGELTEAMKELRHSMETGSLYGAPPANPNPIPVSTSIDTSEVDFTDPVAVKKYIKAEMTNVKTEANKAYVVDQARRMYDQLIDVEFPDLQNTRSDLHRETIKEVRKRMGAEGITNLEEMRAKNPSIFYDAACTATLQINRKRTPVNPQEDRRLSNITGGYVESGNNPPPPIVTTPVITPEQRFFAERFGVDPKVLENTKYEKGSDGVYRRTQ